MQKPSVQNPSSDIKKTAVQQPKNTTTTRQAPSSPKPSQAPLNKPATK
ncbi:hypothetical protein QWZ03_02870 [Chitinimonas viridis]|uniref:Uncharacterized protein n=1 Tax=Chitinimonas viridis TaxID=664880 RepID=A0ABT8B1G7_9NEIS|nr:hypothetical protein [Chitinimonas viridis]MDN3575712.1 hypothetical protein [Chitinimonas viridis]